MPVRLTFLTSIRQTDQNDKLPVPAGAVGGQTMATAGSSDPTPARAAFVEVSTTESIAINGYGSGTEAWMFANETRWFPATEGQTFTWSVRS
jgi:hypothetical protein